MSEGIQTAAVIGAGVMGTAIAAHLAGAGVRVHLLDIVPKETSDRSALAKGALKKALKTKPAPFFLASDAQAVTPGNLEDDLARLKACDLVIEAVVENLEIKKKLFSTIAPHLSAGCILASNTSGLSLAGMNAALPQALRSRFLVMHFFNPVRYMRLLEVVPGPDTDPTVVDRIARFGEDLGKGIVYGKDTTNFIANRIGVYSMMLAKHEMLARKLTIEQVDAIAGRPMARPKSAAFVTGDIVGIDTLIHVAQNCYDSLKDDPERETFRMPAFVTALAKEGSLGRKSGAGFYKKVGKDILVRDLQTGEYRQKKEVTFASIAAALKVKGGPAARVRTLVTGKDVAGEFAWAVVAKTLCYSAALVGEIADDILNVDRAMRWGFNWDLGPFEVWDALGVEESVARMKKSGQKVPRWVEQLLARGQKSFYGGSVSEPLFFDKASSKAAPVPHHPKHLQLAAIKADADRVIEKNKGASLVYLGQGVLCVEVHTKMNTLDADVIHMLGRAVTIAEEHFQAIVVGNDAVHFSAGANLAMIAGSAQAGKWDEVEAIIKGLQDSLQALKYSRVPVVSAPAQYTLGGGAELAMASDATQAFAETYMGLVEVGVGLVPAGCGCLRLAERFSEPLGGLTGDLLPFIGEASLNIAMAKTSTSAEEAKELRFLRETDGISLNRDFLLYQARARAVGMAEAGYRPPRRRKLRAAGYDAAQTIGAKIWGMVEGRWASEHDALIANKVAHILCGGAVAEGTLVSDQHFLDLEREAFLSLCGEKKTQQRVEHMLKTGKPLRN